MFLPTLFQNSDSRHMLWPWVRPSYEPPTHTSVHSGFYTLTPHTMWHIVCFKSNYRLEISSNANATHQWTPIKVLKFAVFRLSHPTLQRPLDEEPKSGGDWTTNHRYCRWLVRNWHLSWFWPIASWCVDHLEHHTAFRLVAVTSLFVHRNAIFFND